MKGFYRSKYNTLDGSVKYYATSQMEPACARYAFPCIDEPDVKAIFDITLENDINLMALSNMPEQRVEILSNNIKRTKFMDTPLMSTYLVALIIGEFDYIRSKTKRGTLVRVITPIGRSSAGEFALDCAVKILETYEEWFKTL